MSKWYRPKLVATNNDLIYILHSGISLDISKKVLKVIGWVNEKWNKQNLDLN